MTDDCLPSSRRAVLRHLVAAGLSGALPAFAQAPYPAKPIRLIVPFTPGGSSDILGRAIGQELARSLGQPVLVDNVPGAGGSIGAERAARAPADGHTLLMGHIGTLAVNPALYPRLGYDPVRDFAPVAWVARVPNVLVVHPSVPARNLSDLVALARARPGAMNYSSGGNGSAAHMTMEYLKQAVRMPMLHIPYRGAAPAVSDVIAGQVQAVFTGAPALLPHIKAGKLRALAVSSPRRIPSLPDVPTIAESGVTGTSGFEADQWYGVVAPAGTPPEVVRLLNEHVNRALGSAEVRTRLASEGADPMPTTPAAFGQLIATELRRWAPVVKAGNIRAE
ncbi:MAG TPA: tripartite tricarboxylate transporter substrate binding protein [Ramlibacter sp.]|jgi:tripartite-type tricarboxylate transporter receptor subunit TctC|uniref:Bug family tripartite tricarboxylate transporter substrate binding protein n=1 Tax=Ramlibacter sp. TaxID=1917967 RepID=UPI002D274291|nr:tripartite tricarboxylate transporter substrate binding protein [Ramlibacter sp.]HZY18002.1 tripartite tricarboxylate transporter substrate binding protein [Ramlibacter sp.]